MADKKKLLIILNDAPFFISHRFPVAAAALKKGFEVHIATPNEEKAVKKIISAGFQHHCIPLHRGKRNPIAELYLIITLWILLRNLKPTITHCVTMKPVLYAGIISRLMRIPSVHAVTGLGYIFVKNNLVSLILRKTIMKAYRFSLNNKNSISIFQNPDDMELFNINKIVSKKNCVIIPGCGVDYNKYKPTKKPEGTPIVMFPARIIGDKGVNEFVEASKILKSKNINVRLVLVGKNDKQNPTNIKEKQIIEWVEQEIVEWWGFSDDMMNTFSKASIICLPSYREGLPRVLIEAASSGLPIITTDVPGCREIVQNNFNGILVPVKNSYAIADAIIALLKEPQLIKKMGANGRKIVMNKFNEENFVNNSLKIYEYLSNTL